MNDKELKSLFRNHGESETLKTPKGEWEKITLKKQLVPLPNRLGARIGIAFALICLFTLTMSPYFKTSSTAQPGELVEYMLEDSFPYEEEGMTSIEDVL